MNSKKIETVVFDIDNTVSFETEFILENGPKYLKEKFGIDAIVKNPEGANISEIFGMFEYFKETDPSLTEAQISLKCKKLIASYNSKYFLKMIMKPLNPEAKKIIDNLKKTKKRIVFITLRGVKSKQQEKVKDSIIRTVVVPLLTKFQLRLNGIKFNKIYFVKEAGEKKSIIENLKPTYVFEDTIEVIESLKNLDTTTICVDRPHNRNFDFNNPKVIKTKLEENLIRKIVESEQIQSTEESLQIKQKSKNKKKTIGSQIKNLKVYQKMYTESFYVLARNVSKNKIFQTYKPIVIGEENLPKEKGPNIFVGNHRNIKDPIITIATLKNPIHFAALKRMFEYNENMFGKVGKNWGTVLTTLFVKSIGALPIARSGDKDYRLTNIQTFNYMKQYLEKNSAIGFYPEGTLNRNPKENGNILPLKSNQVFKLGEKGKGVIYPTAIVWVPKEIDIEHRVLLAYLKPIYTEDLTADEISEIWTKSMNRAIIIMNEIMENLILLQKENIEDEKTKEEMVRKLKNREI